jgi:hypothetical protein
MDCGEPAVPLERPLYPYECDLPRCGKCEWNHLGEILQIMEESGVGPSAVAQRYAEEVGMPVREALDQLVVERKNGRTFSRDENMLAMACTLAEIGVYCVVGDGPGQPLEQL